MNDLDVVTGAFGYTGSYIARRLLDRGRHVRTLTGHPKTEHDLGDRIEVAALDFNDPLRLARDLEGADTLYNTYWVRFDRGETTFEQAVADSTTLIQAAVDADVRRIVHISITNANEDSPFRYFSGKAEVERAVIESGLDYLIVRPTVVFGREDVIVNNIAWIARRIPIFLAPGDGTYRLRPVYVDDVARLATEIPDGRGHNGIVDAVGPDVLTFRGFVQTIAAAVGRRITIVPVPSEIALRAAQALSLVVGDVMMTRPEMEGLMQELVMSEAPTSGATSFKAWISENGEALGRKYASELDRHYR